MFSVYCPSHKARVLLGPDNVEGIVNGPGGIELKWRCWCGETDVELVGQSPTPHADPQTDPQTRLRTA